MTEPPPLHEAVDRLKSALADAYAPLIRLATRAVEWLNQRLTQ